MTTRGVKIALNLLQGIFITLASFILRFFKFQQDEMGITKFFLEILFNCEAWGVIRLHFCCYQKLLDYKRMVFVTAPLKYCFTMNSSHPKMLIG